MARVRSAAWGFAVGRGLRAEGSGGGLRRGAGAWLFHSAPCVAAAYLSALLDWWGQASPLPSSRTCVARGKLSRASARRRCSRRPRRARRPPGARWSSRSGGRSAAQRAEHLQVVVSRVRAACGRGRDRARRRRLPAGRRAGRGRQRLVGGRWPGRPRPRSERDGALAVKLAGEALALAQGLPAVSEAEEGPLAEGGRGRHGRRGGRPLRPPAARAASRTGAHADALPRAVCGVRAGGPRRTSRCWPTSKKEAAVSGPAWHSDASSGTGGTCVTGSAPTWARRCGGRSGPCWLWTARSAGGCARLEPS